MNIAPHGVNIKATTTEGLGVIGKGQGIGAMCVALIE
jgi:2-C-methyl-D-erythritol 2,4-cyclodiphosphate synthase